MEEVVTVKLKWNGKELEASVEQGETVAGLKRVLELQTNVIAKKQKLLGLKTKAGKPAADDTLLKDVALKPNQRVLLMGTAEADLEALAAQELVEPHIQVHDDFDEATDEVSPAELINHPDVQEKLNRRTLAAVIKELNPPRPGKKCAVFDIDYTIFALDSKSENPLDLARPHLHRFFTAIYPYYDLVIWSATSMKWIDVKLRELGISTHSDYKISLTMDYTSMVTVASQGHSRPVFDCKPLAVLWRRYSEYYGPHNTIMLDDLRRNYVLNPQNGLVVRPFRNALTSGRNDRELLHLEAYFIKIAALERLSDLDHKRWEKYAKKEIAELEELHPEAP